MPTINKVTPPQNKIPWRRLCTWYEWSWWTRTIYDMN